MPDGAVATELPQPPVELSPTFQHPPEPLSQEPTHTPLRSPHMGDDANMQDFMRQMIAEEQYKAAMSVRPKVQQHSSPHKSPGKLGKMMEVVGKHPILMAPIGLILLIFTSIFRARSAERGGGGGGGMAH